MKNSLLVLPRIAALVGAAAILLCAIEARGESTLQGLHHHVRPAVASGKAVPVGLLPASQRLNLAIMLPLRNQGEMMNLLRELYDPASPNYRQFLSVGQFTERFAPTVEEYKEVVDFAEANGFTVTDTPANRLIVDISG